jgi:dynactin complex subunit
MISSKRSRFKAFARYIGEVEGERGPWVGVEVPIGEWGADKLEGRDWNDGSWRGIRYFEIGSPTDDGDGRAARRRRLDDLFGASSSILPSSGKKREGDTLSIDQDRMKRIRSASPAASDVSILETRGLFVRPQQILLVIGAQDTD